MTSLFNVTFNDGYLIHPTTGFDQVEVSGGTIQLLAAAAYEGAYGLQCTPLSSYRAGGGKVIRNPTSGKLRQAFWFDPNTITIPSGSYIQIGRNFHYDLSQQVYTILLTWNGSSYAIQIGMSDNTLAPTVWSSDYTITDDWHLIETYWQRGSPGSMQFWIDGNSKETINATNNLAWINLPGIGCNMRSSPSVSTTGSVCFDKWRANDDGSLIGS